MPLSASDERLIEQFVIRDDSLSDAQRQTLRDLLENSPEARALRAEFERFYVEFDPEVESDDVREAVDAFVSTLGLDDEPRGPVRLHSIRHILPPGPTVLAAKAATRAVPRFEPLAVLGDRHQGVIFRLLRDNETGELLAFLIGRAFGPSLLEIPGFALEIVIGSNGRGRVRSTKRLPDWDTVAAVWHPSAAVLRLDEPGEAASNGFGVSVSSSGGAFALSASGVKRSLVVEHEGGTVHLRGDADARVRTPRIDLRFPASFAFCP